MSASSHKRYAVILPAHNEEPCLAAVLTELQSVLDPERFAFAVGVNDSSDRTAEIARAHGAIVGETEARGYGYGCQVGVEEIERRGIEVDGFVFCAADGANDPRDILVLAARHQVGATMVLGSRTAESANWTAMNMHYVLANRAYGFLVGLLTGHFFTDLGPLRLIQRDLFHAMRLREWTFGWTIEAQVRAVLLGANIVEVPVRERPRLAGEQKVGRVSWQRTLSIGLRIAAAGVRSRFNSSQAVRAQPVAVRLVAP
jgi:glycosyltransferase involved in cell wall biosynthesis